MANEPFVVWGDCFKLRIGRGDGPIYGRVEGADRLVGSRCGLFVRDASAIVE
jgi:hypothetical protein